MTPTKSQFEPDTTGIHVVLQLANPRLRIPCPVAIFALTCPVARPALFLCHVWALLLQVFKELKLEKNSSSFNSVRGWNVLALAEPSRLDLDEPHGLHRPQVGGDFVGRQVGHVGEFVCAGSIPAEPIALFSQSTLTASSKAFNGYILLRPALSEKYGPA